MKVRLMAKTKMASKEEAKGSPDVGTPQVSAGAAVPSTTAVLTIADTKWRGDLEKLRNSPWADRLDPSARVQLNRCCSEIQGIMTGMEG